jgi:hemolysin activation/secretion protein
MKKIFAALIGCAFAVMMQHAPAHAAAGSQSPYDAGRVTDQLKERPAAQAPRKPAQIAVTEETKAPVQEGAGIKVKVKSFRITGSSVYSESELQSLVSSFIGKEVSLSDLQQATAKIASYYRERGGYLLAYAYLPPQEINGGEIHIAVLEGKVDKVIVNKSPGTRILNDVVTNGLRGIKTGAVLNRDDLENRLLILSDLPGLDVRSELRPGSTTGTTDLILNVQEKPLLSASLDTDNYGNRFSGEYRGGATLNLNNATGRGDQLTVRGVFAGEGMMFLKSSYAIPVTNYGTKAGISFSYMNYKLGEEFKDLNQKGDTKTVGGFVSHPLLVTSDITLYAQLGYDFRMVSDKVLNFDTNKYLNAANGGLRFSAVDKFAGGGITNASLFALGGNLNLSGSTPGGTSRQLDAKSTGGPDTNGTYGKTMLNFSRLQSLMTGSTFFYLSFDGQVAFKNLDSTEKYSLGGAYGVRAYPMGEASGDDGFVNTVELRQNLTFLKSSIPGEVQLAGFYDVGLVRLNHEAFNGGSDDTVSRAGVGVGVNWGKTDDFAVRASAAWMTGGVPAHISDDTHRKPRIWFQVVKWF